MGDRETTRTAEEEDNLVRSTKRSKSCRADTAEEGPEGVTRHSYRDIVCDPSSFQAMDTDSLYEEDDDVSDDDIVEDLDDDSCFSMGMSKHEKIAARRP